MIYWHIFGRDRYDFKCAIEAQNGRGDIKATGLNILKGFFAVNLFNIVSIRLYQFCISLQASLTSDIAGINVSNGIGSTAAEILGNITASAMSANPIVMLFAVIMMGYAVIKVFFANLKRGGCGQIALKIRKEETEVNGIPITMASLFDGIGGFPKAGERYGIKTLWASEVEPFPITHSCAVTS